MNEGHTNEEQNRVVIRDKRRFDPETGQPRRPPGEPRHAAEEEQTEVYDENSPAEATDAEIEAGVLFEPRRKAAPSSPPSPGAAALQRKLAERTSDLQRITAEYANYRKRVERDRAAAAEAGTGAVLAALLPVVDNVDRAREHGDLTGAFKAVADQLTDTMSRLGLEPFGKAGDPFDPMIHEAVAHQTSPEVSEPTCVTIMRVGYRHGERLLRPALVGVADPESPGAGGTRGAGSSGAAGSSGSPGGATGASGLGSSTGTASGDDDVRL